VKVWDAREYRNLDDRDWARANQVALRRLRKFAREGAPEELDLDTTIDKTAPRRDSRLTCARAPNAVKSDVLDIAARWTTTSNCARTVSAAKTEFKHLSISTSQLLYDYVWKDNLRSTPSAPHLRHHAQVRARL